jgi:hypothetical protein
MYQVRWRFEIQNHEPRTFHVTHYGNINRLRRKGLAWQNRVTGGFVRTSDARLSRLDSISKSAFLHGNTMLFRDMHLVSMIMTRAPQLFWAKPLEDYCAPEKGRLEAWSDGLCLTEKYARAALTFWYRDSKWRHEACPRRSPAAAFCQWPETYISSCMDEESPNA